MGHYSIEEPVKSRLTLELSRNLQITLKRLMNPVQTHTFFCVSGKKCDNYQNELTTKKCLPVYL